ncbi:MULTISPECIES: methyltransferase domain-containing protein [unclassified Rhodococcus (in: high G+C Gram-positive bacteria)]|uniref:class I SAM-dependent methyltransferase n=1 Tax=Rhodococcus sp. SJ-3 TaxID=3454628 RepID=UPI002DA74955|nr:class I SAM-dependent methyltransferase [Rhodococcus sp. (in: high G+C Gram-positive bacteria)]
MHQHSHHQPHRHSDSPADLLDLDAEVHSEYLKDLVDWVADRVDPRVIVDVGAGTGTGTRVLAARFPEAEVIAVDRSPEMLARIRDTADRHDVRGRVTTVEADLDAGWPAVDSPHLVWAALSLHHVQEPDTFLRELHDSLDPGALVVVIEMESQPRFLPDDIGIGTPGLEARAHALAGERGWNNHPDWTGDLERAGFDVEAVRRTEIDLDGTTPTARTYARTVLGKLRHGLENGLSADDLEVLAQLSSNHGPHSVLSRNDLRVRGHRTAWAARKLDLGVNR